MTYIIKKLTLILITGYILIFFSELMFWSKYGNESTEGVSFPDILLVWLGYSFVAYILISIIQEFKIRNIWAVFLVGAVYGWLVEGVLAQTLYDNFPMNISWTGLAWHAPITILVGWYIIRKTLRENKYFKTAILSSLIGSAYGLWATIWWSEPGHEVIPLLDFSLYVFVTTVLLMMSYWIYDKLQPFSLRTSRIEKWCLLFATIIFFIIGSLFTHAWISLILPSLLAGTYLVLRRNKKIETQQDLIQIFLDGNVKTTNYLLLLLIPIFAITVYAAALSVNLVIQSSLFFYYPLSIVGVFLFILSVVNILKRKVN